MSNGRTSPTLCGCEDESGRLAGDYVVKLRGGMDRGERGLLCEAIATRLATYFTIAVPEPAVILVDGQFADLVAAAEPAHGRRFRASVGLNFGSRQLSGVSEWPVDKWIPDAMWQSAVNIFAFDALIQNPDRRYNNQNLFTRGNEVYIYDHELAFSFLEDVAPSGTAWRVEAFSFLAEHVFYRRLKKKPIDYGWIHRGARGPAGRVTRRSSGGGTIGVE
jgi:hypothetical protein